MGVVKLSRWAELNEVTIRTAYGMFHRGEIPGAKQFSTGTIRIDEQAIDAPRRLVGYARVSSSDQKADLVRQSDRLKTSGCVEVISEVGSGLNGNRPKLKKLLSSNDDIVVEHRERLARFGVDYIEASLAPQGRRIVVLDETEVSDDLVQDMIDVLTSFCARLYGRRSSANRAARIAECLKVDEVE